MSAVSSSRHVLSRALAGSAAGRRCAAHAARRVQLRQRQRVAPACAFLVPSRTQFTGSGNDATFTSSQLEMEPCGPSQLKPKPEVKDLAFGKVFTDHMLRIKWTSKDGWGRPHIGPVQEMKIHPGAKVLHYAQELFEGMKAYRGVDDKIRLFRPMHNMARMNVSAKRSCFPTFDGQELMECIRKLVQIDQEWVPHCTSSSLYIRPTMIGTEATLGVAPANECELFVLLCPVGPYFASGFKAVNLLADPRFVRAWPGGSGFAKMGSNYAPTLWVSKFAEQFDCQQVLWLLGEDHEVTEVGAMNIFVFLDKGDGTKELVTPSLGSGVILPGVTRRSLVELTQSWGEFQVSERKITMGEILQAKSEDRLLEVFGAGTAATVSPVGGIYYDGEMRTMPTPKDGLAARLMSSMSDIYYGRLPEHPWVVDLEEWKLDANQQLQDYKIAALEV